VQPQNKLKVAQRIKQMQEHRLTNAGRKPRNVVEPKGSLIPFSPETRKTVQGSETDKT